MAEDPVTIVQARAALGARLAALRTAVGHTQTSFAPLTFYGRSSIANIETGRQSAPRTFWTLCDEILKTGGLLTQEHDRLIHLRVEQQITVYQGSSDLRQQPAEPPVESSAADGLLTHLAGVAGACGLMARTPAAGRRRIALTDVTRLLAVTDLYRSVDRERGGRDLRRQLAQVAETATLWLDPGQTAVEPSVQQRLASAVAGVRLIAGWTAFDAGFYEDSHRHFALAERAAVHATDPLLAARVRYCQTRQLQHRHHNIDALHTIQFARADLGSSATPAVLTMLLGAEAASLAALGRREDALRCLAQASDAFTRVDFENEPTWMLFYDTGELCAQYGRVYRDLARRHLANHRTGVPTSDPRYGAQAVHWVQQALAEFSPDNVRSVVLNKISLCSALMLAHAPDQALDAGNELLTATAGVSSQRVIERLHNLQRDFGPHRRRPDVAEFAHIITGTGAAT